MAKGMLRCSPAVGFAALAMLLVSCAGSDASAPSHLVDGSEAKAPAIALEGVSEPAVVTKVTVVNAGGEPPGSASAACAFAHDIAEPPRRVVERVGVLGSTATFATSAGLYGCDDTPGDREGGKPWCGVSFGTRTARRLDDPRLDVAGCVTSEGKPSAFAWIEPGATTRFIAVKQAGYVEVYEPAGSLPVRIATTTGIEIEGSRATFELSEHDATGAQLRRYELQVAAAG